VEGAIIHSLQIQSSQHTTRVKVTLLDSSSSASLRGNIAVYEFVHSLFRLWILHAMEMDNTWITPVCLPFAGR
jgi:hypothetical protein